MSHYEGIAHYYDLMMSAGYYDHKSLGAAVRSAIGQRKKLIELGVGTGLLAQELIRIDSSYDIAGIDYSPALLEIARRRLPASVSLVECDVAEMKLDNKFDVAVSCGGTWVIIESNNEMQLGTHLFDRKKDFRGLQNVADHLNSGGLLLLSVHPPHEDRDLSLGDGIVYSQEIGERSAAQDHFSLLKKYCFTRNGKTIAEETMTLGFFNNSAFPKLLTDAGFEPLGLTTTREFFVAKRRCTQDT